MVAYNERGNYEKATEINRWTLTEHPDYLFARLNEANEYLNSEEFNKVPEILGELFELKALYPDRDIFHLSEITNFLKSVIRYFALTGQIDLAENRLKMLGEIAMGHPDFNEAQQFLNYGITKKAVERFKNANQKRITPKQIKIAEKTGFSISPDFTHPEINWLYEVSIDFPEEIIRQLLTLPHESLVDDLEKVMEDAIIRYGYFHYNEDELADFLIHSFVFLSELPSEKSLSAMLSVLEYDKNFLDFWFGDHITETLWHCLYKLGQNQTGLLKEFLLKPGIDAYAKSTVTDALSQIVWHQPERHAEIENIFAEVFNRFLNATPDENLIDSSFLDMTVANAIDLGFINMLPVIKELYDREIVDFDTNGDYNEVVKFFEEPLTEEWKKEIFDIYGLYNEMNLKFGDNKDYDEDIGEGISKGVNFLPDPASKQIQAVSQKVGRNDPCPCGSGLKYKKCCGK
jgi:tetratricopeptide (TPR) repeat protein